MRTIFLSYRRDDSEGQAGRLYDALAARFGESAVFMDVSDIAPGRDFRWVIDEHVNTCGVLLALIGKHWLQARDSHGQRRLDDATDFVRLETVSALQRGIPVVPVLVHGARMPKADELPQELQPLAYRNGVELTHARWDSDVEVLVKALEPYVDAAPRRHASESDAPRGATRRAWVWRTATAAFAALALGGGYVGHQIYSERAANDARQAEQQRLAQAREREVAAEQEKAARQAQVDAEQAQQAAERQRVAAEKAQLEVQRAEQQRADRARKQHIAAEQEKAARQAQVDAEQAQQAAERQRVAAEKAQLEAQRAEQQRRTEAERNATQTAQAERDAAIAKLERAKRMVAAERAQREAEQRARQNASQAYGEKARKTEIQLSGACAPGYVWREARPNDRTCVPPASRTQAAADNHLAASRREARGGAYGPATCKPGYVWREAFSGDTVCVVPEVRARTAEENARAPTRIASTTRAATP